MRHCQAEARAPCRHFLGQKKVAKDCRCAGLFCPQAMFRESLGCAPLSFFCPTVVSVYQITPVGPEVRASLSLPRESDKERPGSPPGPRAGRQPSNGGCRPGLPLDSRPNPGLHWPPGRIGAPCAAGPGRGASAQPATGRGRFWADVSPLGRMWEMGPKRQPGTGGVAPAGTKILSAFGFQDFIAFFCPGSILRERGTT